MVHKHLNASKVVQLKQFLQSTQAVNNVRFKIYANVCVLDSHFVCEYLWLLMRSHCQICLHTSLEVSELKQFKVSWLS